MNSTIITALLLSLTLLSFQSQTVKYVCTPCGRNCDIETYDKPGTCPECGMKLVDALKGAFKTVNFDQLCDRLKANKDIVLLDVRSPGEFNNTSMGDNYGKFKKALNINITDIQRRVGEIEKYKDKEVIVYCSHSHRSPEVSYFLSTHGFKNVANVAGGVSELGGKAKECLKGEFVEY